jgi:hypothetical protein
MTLSVTWSQALAWRMERHFLSRIEDHSVEAVVGRLCGVQAQVASSAELAIRLRQDQSRGGEVAKALSDGRLVKTWAMRGTLHYLTAAEAGNYLAILASSRAWEAPIWERYFGVSPAQIEALRGIVRDSLGEEALTREELIEHVTRHRGYEHLGDALRSGWGTIFKPLAWQGDIVNGPARGGRVTFVRPEVASRDWVGLPNIEDAWRTAVLNYLGAYGPATIDHFSAWIARGTVKKRELRTRFAEMGDLLAEVDVEGETAYVPNDQLDDLASATASTQVRLLGGFDQWVLGPGTDDGHVTKEARRRLISKQSGWIAPVVIRGGVASGTWDVDGDAVTVSWFKEAGRPPTRDIDAEVKRLAMIFGRDLSAEFRAV